MQTFENLCGFSSEFCSPSKVSTFDNSGYGALVVCFHHSNSNNIINTHSVVVFVCRMASTAPRKKLLIPLNIHFGTQSYVRDDERLWFFFFLAIRRLAWMSNSTLPVWMGYPRGLIKV